MKALPTRGRRDRFASVRFLWLAIFLLTAAMIAVKLNVTVPVLTSNEIIDGEERFDEAELTRLVGKVFAPFHNLNKRDLVLERIGEEFDRFDPAARRRIVEEGLRFSLAEARREQALLAPQDRRRMPEMLALLASDSIPAEEGFRFETEQAERLLLPIPEDERESWRPAVERWLYFFQRGE